MNHNPDETIDKNHHQYSLYDPDPQNTNAGCHLRASISGILYNGRPFSFFSLMISPAIQEYL